jgi:hypothetical protein
MGDKRALAMLALYKQGATLQEIGTRYRLTRERVRQILKAKFSAGRLDGGKHLRSTRRHEQIAHAAEERSMVRWGCTTAQLKEIPTIARKAWREQSRNAKNRGIPFKLTLWQFWKFWSQSGRWQQRGRHGHEYCMSRLNDDGAYEIGNIQVLTIAENCRLYQLLDPSSRKRRTKDLQGVTMAMPGCRKPYKAYYGHKHLGFFATESEAYQARRQHVEALST